MNNLLEPTAENLYRILKRLRAPDGCPWDRAQTRASFARYLAEECAEALDAIDEEDVEKMPDELGDLLMNVMLQAIVGEEKGEFTWEDVLRCIVEKMVRRHSHVFGENTAATPEEVVKLWDTIKSGEKLHSSPKGVLGEVPRSLSPLASAEKLQKKAAKYGFDWSSEKGILAKIHEELQEVEEAMSRGSGADVEEELGDLLFAVTNLTRFRKQHSADELLRRANRKFQRRFEQMAQRMQESGISLTDASIEQMEAFWDTVKKEERK